MEKIISTKWDAQNSLLLTTLRGRVNVNDVREWESTLAGAWQQVPDDGQFKMLVNLYGFDAESMDVHKQYRTIMPLFLAGCGYRIGYLDMFPEAVVDLRTTRGVRCVAMANVHHNSEKMKDYQKRFSSDHEAYFTDQDEALTWITRLEY